MTQGILTQTGAGTNGGYRPVREDLARELIRNLDKDGPEPMKGEPQIALASIRDALRAEATDLHIDPYENGHRYRLRIDGSLIDAALIGPDLTRRLVNQLKTLARIDPVTTFQPIDSRFSVSIDGRAVDLRMSLMPCIGGEKIAIRLLEARRVVRRIDELGMSEPHLRILRNCANHLEGMFLVAGPIGCGKTTTLYALLHELKIIMGNVVTLEDPVEYQISGINQVQIDQAHGLTFAEGIESVLRLDPDYLLVGEVRDPKSARAALDAAITGLPLMATLHSRDAVGALSALRNYDLPDRELGSTLGVIVSQRLVRRLCPHCREEQEPTPLQRAWLRDLDVEVPDHVWQAHGCGRCRGLGYAGRTGVFEVWDVSESDRCAILDHEPIQKIRSCLRKSGKPDIRQDALNKAQQGITSLDEIIHTVY